MFITINWKDLYLCAKSEKCILALNVLKESWCGSSCIIVQIMQDCVPACCACIKPIFSSKAQE